MACPDGSFGPVVTLGDMACPDGSFGPVVTLDDMASPDGSFGPVVAQYSGTLDDMAAPMAHLARVWLDTQRHLMIWRPRWLIWSGCGSILSDT